MIISKLQSRLMKKTLKQKNIFFTVISNQYHSWFYFIQCTYIIWKCWKNSQLIKKVRRKWIVEELSLLKRPDRAGQREGRRMYKGLYYWLSIQYAFSRLYFLPFPVLQTLCPFWAFRVCPAVLLLSSSSGDNFAEL